MLNIYSWCMQGTVLEGHALILQLSHNSKKACGSDSKTSATKGKAESKESSTKIIVRNVAFEATRKDLQQIFNPFGQARELNFFVSCIHCRQSYVLLSERLIVKEQLQ